MRTPSEVGGHCTQAVYVIVDDADAIHARAVAAGAEILLTLVDQDYGGRGFSVALTLPRQLLRRT